MKVLLQYRLIGIVLISLSMSAAPLLFEVYSVGKILVVIATVHKFPVTKAALLFFSVGLVWWDWGFCWWGHCLAVPSACCPSWSSPLAPLDPAGLWMNEGKPHFSQLWKSSPFFCPPDIHLIFSLDVNSFPEPNLKTFCHTFTIAYLFGETFKNCMVPVAQFPVTLFWKTTSVCFQSLY